MDAIKFMKEKRRMCYSHLKCTEDFHLRKAMNESRLAEVGDRNE